MVWFVFSMIAFAVGAIAILVAIFSGSKVAAGITAAVSVVLGIVFLFLATFWQNGEGEAKVLVNSVDRQVVGEITVPGNGYKSPWVDFVEWDTFNQEVVYAGETSEAPSYTGGTVNGREITASVGGVSGGSTKAAIDATFVYSIDPKEGNLTALYREYRSQDRFTKMVIEKTILSVVRTIPSSYTATEFRGTLRAEAEQKILDTLNDRLNKYGVEFAQVSIQDVRYPAAVEEALTAIEKANQEAQKAEADQRTAEAVAQKNLIEAQGDANAKIERARGEAESNRILTESLTDAVLEQRRIDALMEAARNGNLIVDGNGGILIQK